MKGLAFLTDSGGSCGFESCIPRLDRKPLSVVGNCFVRRKLWTNKADAHYQLDSKIVCQRGRNILEWPWRWGVFVGVQLMHDGANFNSPLCPPLISSLFFCCEDLKRPRSYLYIKRGDPLIHLFYYLPSTWILLSSWSSLPSIVIIIRYRRRHHHRHSRRHLSSFLIERRFYFGLPELLKLYLMLVRGLFGLSSLLDEENVWQTVGIGRHSDGLLSFYHVNHHLVQWSCLLSFLNEVFPTCWTPGAARGHRFVGNYDS